MTVPSKDRLTEIQARVNAATEGPWEIETDSDTMGDYGPVAEWNWRIKGVVDFTEEETSDADAEFIAHAREDVPYLLAVVSQMQAERDDAVSALLKLAELRAVVSQMQQRVAEAERIAANYERYDVWQGLQAENLRLEAVVSQMQDALRAERVATVKAVLSLMRTSSLPYGEWEPDAIAPHSNGYSMWFIGRENFVNGDVSTGQQFGTAPLSAEAIVDRIEARAVLAASSPDTPEQDA